MVNPMNHWNTVTCSDSKKSAVAMGPGEPVFRQ
jgi:hypothetical protein